MKIESSKLREMFVTSIMRDDLYSYTDFFDQVIPIDRNQFVLVKDNYKYLVTVQETHVSDEDSLLEKDFEKISLARHPIPDAQDSEEIEETVDQTNDLTMPDVILKIPIDSLRSLATTIIVKATKDLAKELEKLGYRIILSRGTFTPMYSEVYPPTDSTYYLFFPGRSYIYIDTFSVSGLLGYLESNPNITYAEIILDKSEEQSDCLIDQDLQFEKIKIEDLYDREGTTLVLATKELAGALSIHGYFWADFGYSYGARKPPSLIKANYPPKEHTFYIFNHLKYETSHVILKSLKEIAEYTRKMDAEIVEIDLESSNSAKK